MVESAEELQLLASAALLVSAKMEERRDGIEGHLVLVGGGAFTMRQLLNLEVAILQVTVRFYCRIVFKFLKLKFMS